MHALQFATYKHRFQKRKDADQTPYINHPIGKFHNKDFEKKNLHFV
jgi:hypothetical protein